MQCKAAVDATKGIVAKNGASFTATYYTASNGGQTESIKNAWGSSGYAYLAVKDDPYDLANPDSRKQFEQRNEFGMYVVNCLNKALPEASPAGTSMLFFTIPVMPGDFPGDLKPEEYKKWKNAVAEKYIRDYEETMGLSVREHIEEIAVATPVTFARYLATPDGEIYGYSSEKWDNVVSRSALKDMENKIPHLYFCGGHGMRGDGYPSAYITGAMAANDVIGSLREEEK